jgi:thymidylate synthase (FAD)
VFQQTTLSRIGQSGVTKVLDHGFVELIDVMGDDATIARDARVSRGHGGEERPWEQDAKLIKFMWDNGHTTPFEMIETKWMARMPIFVAREWVRHRTASITEFSMRYADARELSRGEVLFYTPEQWREQDTKNKQGSLNSLKAYESLTLSYQSTMWQAISTYDWMLQQGVAREMARMVLPVSIYTEWIWKIDLKNLLHFLRLRTAGNAQWEIRQYANVMLDLLRERFPLLMEVVWPSE